MTTINEGLTAKGYTPAALVPSVFGQPRTIEGIVIHHWGALGQTHDGVVDFFCTTGPGLTSAHFVASAGRINCIVSPPDAAWHCPGKNATHIGIECRPEATDADYATVAELVNFLRATYGPLPLSMHRDWYNTACPGVWDLKRIDQIAAGSAAIAPQSSTITPQEDTLSTAEVKEIKDHINAVMLGGYVWQGSTHPGIGMVVEENQRRIGSVPAAVLSQSFKLPDGTVTNLSGILTAIHATPTTGGAVVTTDPQAVASAVAATLALKLGK